jgi:hypothetical protein
VPLQSAHGWPVLSPADRAHTILTRESTGPGCLVTPPSTLLAQAKVRTVSVAIVLAAMEAQTIETAPMSIISALPNLQAMGLEGSARM